MPRPEVSVLIKAKDLASRVFGRFQRNIRSITRTAKNVARGLATFGGAATAATVALQKMSERGASVVAVKRAFAKVTDDETAALQRLRDATAGTVRDFDLMRLTNQALALGAADSAENFADMARAVRLAGQAQGLDAQDSLERFTVGMARLSARRLDDLGITVRQAEADRRLAAELGKEVSQLTEAEKATAFRNEAVREAIRLAEDLSAGELGAVEAGDKLAATIGNIRDRLAELVANSPAVQTYFEQLSFFLRELSGEDTSASAIETGLARITDPRVLQSRFRGVAAERERLEAEIAEVEARLEGLGTGRGPGGGVMAAAPQIERLQRLREELSLVEREAAAVGRRLVEVSTPKTKDPDETEGPPVRRFEGTEANLRGLLDELRETQGALDEARLAEALAAPGEEAEKAAEKVQDLSTRLEHLRSLSQGFGGQLGLAAMFDPTPLLSQPDPDQLAARAGGMVTDFRPTVTPLLGVPPALEQGQEQLEEGGEAFGRAAEVATASFFSMSEAAIRGTAQVEQSVISMITRILQASSGGGVLGAVIGGVGGLLGAVFGRNRDPVPVRLSDVDDRAARKMREQEGQPLHVTTIIEQAGVEIERIEKELFARMDRDEAVRFGSSASPLRR